MVSITGPKALTAGVGGATRTFAAQSVGWMGETLSIGDSLAIATTNLTLNDVWTFCKIPPKARIMGYTLDVTGLDSGTALVLSVGTSGSPGLIATGLTIGRSSTAGTSNVMASGALGNQPVATIGDTLMVVKVTTAAGTPVAGTAVLWIQYMCDFTQTSP
jgi:hypothetical protein